MEIKKRSDDKVLETINVIEQRCLRLRRRIGKKVLKSGGNAIIGYNLVIDDEGSKSNRIIIRGYGTAVLLVMDKSLNSDNVDIELNKDTFERKMT